MQQNVGIGVLLKTLNGHENHFPAVFHISASAVHHPA